MNLNTAGCPKALSRKKLRQMMWRNRNSLTGSALAATYGRAPGNGRFKCRLMHERDAIEKAIEKDQRAAEQGKLRAMLMSVVGLLTPSKPPKEKLRAVRARSIG